VFDNYIATHIVQIIQ